LYFKDRLYMFSWYLELVLLLGVLKMCHDICSP
jgi:hypothetical protein